MAIYYVKAGGSDAADGLSDANAWETISKVNGESFSAGDSILFNRGDTWREQLTVPSSGSSGSPITFGAYGTGNDPVINGGAIRTGWTEMGWVESFNANQLSNYTDGATRNYRAVIADSSLSTSGQKIRVTAVASTVGDGSIDGASLGAMTSTNVFDEAPTRITWNTGSDNLALAQGNTYLSDEITFALDATVRHGLHVYTTDRDLRYQSAGADGVYYNSGSSDNTLTLSPSGTLVASGGPTALDIIEVTVENAYKISLASDPTYVIVDGIMAVEASGLHDIAEGEWWYDSDNTELYFRTDGTAIGDYTIETWARSQCVASTDKDYITLENLHLTLGRYGGVYGANGGEGITIQNCTFKNLNNDAIDFAGGAGDDLDITIVSNTFIDAGRLYPIIINPNAGATSSAIIDGNNFSVVTFDGTATTGSNLMKAIQVTALDTCTISNNTVVFPSVVDDTSTIGTNACTTPLIEDNTITGGNHGISILDSVSGGTIRRNRLINIYDDGIWVYGTSDGVSVYSNVISGAHDDGIDIQAINTTVYNNTVYGSVDVGIFVRSTATGITVKNNITYDNGQPGTPTTGDEDGYELYVHADAAGTATIDNNCYYHTTTKVNATPFYWNGTAYNFANYKTNSSQDANSLNEDPLLTDPDNGVFTLQSGSPCKNAGADVSLTTDYTGELTYGYPIGAYGYAYTTARITTAQYGPNIAPDMSYVDMPCLQGDGAGYVVLDSAITLSGDFTISGTVRIDSLSVLSVWFGGSDVADGVLYSDSGTGAMYIYINSTNYTFSTLFATVGEYDFTLSRSGTSLTLTLGDDSETETVVTDDFVINRFLEMPTVNTALISMWNLKIYNSAGTLIHFWPMAGGHPSYTTITDTSAVTMVEDSVGGNHGTATSFSDGCWGVRQGGARSTRVGVVNHLIEGDAAADWGAYGTNTIVDDDNAVKITAVDDTRGAYLFVYDPGAVAADLVVGATYRCSVTAKVDAGDAVRIVFGPTSSGNRTKDFDSTSYVTETFDFVLATGNSPYFFFVFNIGEIIWVKNLSIKQVYPDYDLNDTTFALTQGMSLDRVDDVELFVNGTFTGDADGTDLAQSPGGWTYGSNQVSCDGTNNGTARQDGILITGATCQISFEITAYTSGTLRLHDGTGWLGTLYTATGFYTIEAIAANVNFRLYSVNFIGSVDNVSVKRVIKGYNSVNPLTNLHQDGTSPRYSANTWALALRLPCGLRGAEGPETQAISPQFIDGGDIRLGDESTIGENNKVFWGSRAGALYTEDQLDNIVALDGRLGLLGSDELTNGTFGDGLTGWTVINSTGTVAVTDGQLEVTRVDATTMLYQDILVNSEEYIVDVDIDSVSGTTCHLINNDATTIADLDSLGVGRHFIKYTHAIADGNFIIRAHQNGETLALNSVSVKPISAELGPELVTGGSMADGSTKPTMNGVALVDFGIADAGEVSSEQAHNGDYSLKCVKDIAGDASTRFLDGSDCGLTSGNTYRASVWVYLPSGHDTDIISLKWRNNAGGFATLAGTTVTDQWVELAGNFTDDDAQQVLTVVGENGTAADEYWYVDNFSCREVLSDTHTSITTGSL